MLHMLLTKIESDHLLVERIGQRNLHGMHVGLDLLSTIRQRAVDINKLEHGQRLQPERTSCSVRALLDDVALITAHMPKSGSVHLEVVVSNAVRAADSIMTDRNWLFLILINFLSNAFKHVRTGVVRLSVGLAEDSGGEADTDHQPWLRLQVADNGRGLPDEMLPRLWKSSPNSATVDCRRGSFSSLSPSFKPPSEPASQKSAASIPQSPAAPAATARFEP